MTAPILLPDVHQIKRSATSRPQNLPRKHLGPKINTDQGGVEPPHIVSECACILYPHPEDNATSRRQLVLWQKRGLSSQRPQKVTSPTTPQHTEGKRKKDLGTSGFCPT